MFAGLTPCFSAIRVTTEFDIRGESFEPRGEYAVTAIPLLLQLLAVTPADLRSMSTCAWICSVDNASSSDMPVLFCIKKKLRVQLSCGVKEDLSTSVSAVQGLKREPCAQMDMNDLVAEIAQLQGLHTCIGGETGAQMLQLIILL